MLNAEKRDIKYYLANLFINNFYDNISTLNSKDEQIVYIITLLLKEEIKALKKEDDSFLNDTRCSIVLEQFFEKKEIRFYLKSIIFEIFKKMETVYCSNSILLEHKEINKHLVNKKEINDENKYKNNNQILEKYFYKAFNKEELEKKKLEYENNELKNFIQKKIEEVTKDPHIYLNENFFENIYIYEGQEIMKYYSKSFLQVIDIINTLFDNLLKNVDSVPYSIKCLCKIISILIKQKFPKITFIQHTRFLSHFFFVNLIFPTLINPINKIYINEFNITKLTTINCSKILLILNSLVFGVIFKHNNYTPFNWYIIEKLPQLLEFFKNVCNVKLPNFIEKLVYDNLSDDIEYYDFFKEHSEESFIYRNICFNLNELYILVSYIEKCKDNISISKSTVSKMISKKQLIEKLKNKIQKYYDYQFISDKTEIKYFLLTDLIKNEKFGKIMNIKNKKYFNLKELKQIESEEQKIENNIIKVKNFFFALLYNYEPLSKNIFKEGKLSDIISILKELKKHPNIISYIDNNNNIPSNWYINSLLQYLPKLPKNLKENDFEELLNELEFDISNSIKQINYNELSKLNQYYKEIEIEKSYYEKMKNILNDINLNKKVEDIIKNEEIILHLKITKNKSIDFFSTIVNEKIFLKLFKNFDKTNNIIKTTINSFINDFPKIDIYEIDDNYDNDNDNVYNILSEIAKQKIPEIIENYFNLIKIHLKEKDIVDENNLDNVCNKIYDYIMERLYDKLFPKEPLFTDIKIFRNCYKHVWVELSNLIKDNNYILDDYLFDSCNWLKLFENEKSPRKKLIYLNELYNCVYKLAQFNGDKVDGADDEMPLLLYTLIKSKPQFIFSNCKYTELFLGNKKFTIEGSQLTKIIGICIKLSNLNGEDFHNINISEYNENCKMALEGILY